VDERRLLEIVEIVEVVWLEFPHGRPLIVRTRAPGRTARAAVHAAPSGAKALLPAEADRRTAPRKQRLRNLNGPDDQPDLRSTDELLVLQNLRYPLPRQSYDATKQGIACPGGAGGFERLSKLLACVRKHLLGLCLGRAEFLRRVGGTSQ
jgi:hypothetical protein